MAIFTDVFEDVTKQGRKLQTSEYKECGKYAIIDQGQNDIAGYTDEEAGVFSDVPAIVFGDHTRVVKYIDVPCYLGADGVKLLKAKIANPNYKYLYYALLHADIPNTGYNRHFKWLKEININLPDGSKQQDIVESLDKVSNLISLRKQQLAKLDELVKARFVELFGERLEKETVKLSTLTEVITKGTTPTTLGFEFTESGVNFVKIECITEDSKFLVSKMLHISDECNQKLKRSILKENDVLFSIAGAIGRTAIVTKDILPANTNQAVAIIRLKQNCDLNVNFLNQMLHSSLIEKQVNIKKAGVAQINLSLADIGDFNVVVPPVAEQEQFAAFVEQTDKSKLAIQQSLDKLETLKKSLMQKYFG